MKKLSYSEWREHIGVSIDPTLAEEVEQIHNIDFNKEVESALLQEYGEYLNNLEKVEVVFTRESGKESKLRIDAYLLEEMLLYLVNYKASGFEDSFMIRNISNALHDELFVGEKVEVEGE